MLLLTWAIYDGIRLATAPGQDGKIDHLAFPVGVVTIAFGTIYLIIGLSIVADLAVNLSSVLKRHEDKKQEEDIHNSCHDDNNNSINVLRHSNTVYNINRFCVKHQQLNQNERSASN